MGSSSSPATMDGDHRVIHLSECFIKPQQGLKEFEKRCYLTPWDLAMLSVHYIQKGLLYTKSAHFCIEPFLAQLKDSLASTLAHFYPLAGQLETKREENTKFYLVYVNCDKGPGARLIHAKVDLKVEDLTETTYVSPLVQMFFDHDRCVNHEGHERSLLSIQVTELVDGIFIGFSMNHSIGDGTSYWHFFNMLSETFQAKAKGIEVPISRPPVLTRWFPDGHGPIINLPFNPQEFVSRHNAPQLMERFFHFSSASVAKLKAKANAEANTTSISSFQALSALLWRTITRVRNFPPDQPVGCRLAMNLRPKLHPPLSPDYFGNSIYPVRSKATSGELLTHNLGWSATLLHQAVTNFNNKDVRDFLDKWLQAPYIYQLGQLFDPHSIMMGSSPRFDMYGTQFGLGKALMLRSGYANKFDGKVSSYPGYDGQGSIDLEVCLIPAHMEAFVNDPELLEALAGSVK